MGLPSVGRSEGAIRGLRSRFRVEGLGDHVQTVSALSMGFDAMSAQDGADVAVCNTTPGQPFYNPLRFTGLIHKDTFGDLQAWVKDVHDGKENVQRKTLTYHILHPQQDTTIKQYVLHDCFPSAFNYIEAEVDGGEMMRFDLAVIPTRMTME